MKFDLSEHIAGVPLKKVREVFKKTEIVTDELLNEKIRISNGNQLIIALKKKGFLEEYNHQSGSHITTSLGKSLAASAIHRMNKEKANTVYNSFLDRVRFVNSKESEFAYWIRGVILYDSFLSYPSLESYGDLDLLVDLVPRFDRSSDDQKKLEKERISYRNSFNNFFEQLTWPRTEVIRFLKNKSKFLSIDDDYSITNSIEPKGVFKIVYELEKYPEG